MKLGIDHINYIVRDLYYRGIVIDDLQGELVDHIATSVEKEMEKGTKFIDAYHLVLKSFGQTKGLRSVQQRALQSLNQKTSLMLKNYLSIAVRNLNKHRFYTIINVIGLAVGIASCIIIVLFVFGELSFDRHHQFADRIYRVNTEIKFGGNHLRMANANSALSEILADNFPEIECFARTKSWGPLFVKSANSSENFKETRVRWADSTFFKIFSVPLVEGNADKALMEPNTVAISQTIAEKYFPNGDAIGQSLVFAGNLNHKVTAIYENIPAASHFHYDILVAMAGLDEIKSVSLVSGSDFTTYLLLKEGADAKALEEKFPGIVEKYVAPQIANVVGEDFTMEKWYSAGNRWVYSLTPLTKIHLYSDLMGEVEPNGDIVYVYLFSIIALFILAIACINFMNLSTARSANRAKEVGVRKVMGSMRSHLIRQFLMESIILSIFSFVIAIIVANLALPLFNDFAGKNLSIPTDDLSFYIIATAVAILVGVIAGLYPSFFLSAFKPVQVLKGQFSRGMKSGTIRSIMVVFQFVVSIFLIIGTITVNRQLKFIQDKKIGFEKDQVIVVKDAHLLANNIRSFKEELLLNNFVKGGTISGYFPVAGHWKGGDTFFKEGEKFSQQSLDEMVNMQTWFVDHDYIKTLGMKIKTGRNFSPDFPSDSAAVILNETAVKRFGFSDPIGEGVTTFAGNREDGTPDTESLLAWKVIGVVEDFHFESLRQNIAPLAFFLNENPNGSVAFRFESANTQDVIHAVEDQWRKLAPGQPFQYSFLDDDFERMYASEQRLGKIFAIFAGLAIIIACLGLFALTAFTAEQRTKEIGIRKVLGASVSSIVVLLSKDFGKLVLVAFLISSPVAWYSANWWLKNYTYKVEVGVEMYLLAGASSFLIAWLTMSYQSIKAASTNPVTSLRSE